MFQPRSIQSSMTLRDKVMSMDFILIFSILILGIVSMFAMYSTDGGKFDYHTKSHILRFGIFFHYVSNNFFVSNKVLVSNRYTSISCIFYFAFRG